MNDKPKDNGEFRNEKGQFTKGNPGGPGKPKGSVSPITKIRQIFEANPERFEEFVEGYLRDEKNAKHAVEMLDGKPHQQTDITSGGQPLQVKFDSAFDGTESE